jgi:hypothetical protein
MGNLGAKQNGREKADVPVDESVAGLMDKVLFPTVFLLPSPQPKMCFPETNISKIDRATRENSGGKFVTFDDSPLSW